MILAGLMSYECYTYSKPRWWIPAVFFAPVITPYFIFKSRKESGMILFMVFLTTFSAVVAAESFIYFRYVQENRYAHLPPVTRQMIRLSEELKASTTELDAALVKLENLSKVESRIKEIKTTIEFIGQIRHLMAENQNAIERLVKYTTDYQQYFQRKDLGWVFNVQRFYNNRIVVQHYSSLQTYLQNFEDLLRYTYVNFYKITDLESPEHIRNYDEYYIRYRRAVDAHNRFNVRRIEFQNAFLEQYPDIRPYLPGERQTDTFRLWE